MLGPSDLRVLIYEIPDNPKKSLAFEDAMWRFLELVLFQILLGSGDIGVQLY
ncbi:MAG: hypothetical protein ACP5IE_06690 [Infirmifilum sp.]|jgi:hypothetical protein